jgi:hypothetical protein
MGLDLNPQAAPHFSAVPLRAAGFAVQKGSLFGADDGRLQRLTMRKPDTLYLAPGMAV